MSLEYLLAIPACISLYFQLSAYIHNHSYQHIFTTDTISSQFPAYLHSCQYIFTGVSIFFTAVSVFSRRLSPNLHSCQHIFRLIIISYGCHYIFTAVTISSQSLSYLHSCQDILTAVSITSHGCQYILYLSLPTHGPRRCIDLVFMVHTIFMSLFQFAFQAALKVLHNGFLFSG